MSRQLFAQPVYFTANPVRSATRVYRVSEPILTAQYVWNTGVQNKEAQLVYDVGAPAKNAVPVYLVNPAWWQAGGAYGCVAAYQPKGASSYAASLMDLSGSGHDAFAGSAPTWGAVNGWTGDGVGKYLRTGVVPTAGWSFLVQFSGGLTTGTRCVVGSDGIGSTGFSVFPCSQFYGPAEVFYLAGRNFRKTPPMQAGNLGGVASVVAQGGGYRNGVFEAGTQAGGGPSNLWSGQGYEAYILCLNEIGSANYFFGGSVQAYAIYNNSLTDAQMLAVATAMAAL